MQVSDETVPRGPQGLFFTVPRGPPGLLSVGRSAGPAASSRVACGCAELMGPPPPPHALLFHYLNPSLQENRAYDHYYGMHAGVRGFNDRTAIQLPSGLSSFYQPVDQGDLAKYMLPFHTDSMTTSAQCMPAPTMDYPHDIGIINKGHFDSWNTAREAGMGMAHWNRSDLPYYYKLYESFVAGDQYFQSTYTMTNPNRLHLFSGSNGLSVGKPAVLTNDEPTPGWNWTTMSETLEAANISWKTYQGV